MPDKIDHMAAVHTRRAVACDLQFAKPIGQQCAAGGISVFLRCIILPLGAQHLLDGCRRENLFPAIGSAVHQQFQTVCQLLIGDAQTALRGEHRCIRAGHIACEGKPSLDVLCVRILQVDGLCFRLAAVIVIRLAVPGAIFIPGAVFVLLLIDRAELCKAALRKIAGHIVCCRIQLL